MKNICDVDKNFLTVTGIDKQDAVFYRLPAEPFQINGVFYADGKFRRLPESVASATSSAVHFLHANTAGGRLRFRTDSSYVAISVKMENICKMSHFATTGSAGFDLYADEGDGLRYIASFRPPIDMDEGFQSVVELGAKKMRSITIHFPLYSDVTELWISTTPTIWDSTQWPGYWANRSGKFFDRTPSLYGNIPRMWFAATSGGSSFISLMPHIFAAFR